MKTFICLLFLCLTAVAQEAPPVLDIYYGPVTWKEGLPHIETLENITRREGYDSQPAFLPDGNILYTSIRGDQADIFRYEPKTGKHIQLTDTAESEYSPTPMADGKHFSTVRVEADQTQRLWRFPLKGGTPSLVLPEVRNVGYHLWLTPEKLALFIVGPPHWLHLADITGKSQKLLEHSGRCYALIPGEAAFSAVQKLANDIWIIRSISLDGKKKSDLIHTPGQAEDYCWSKKKLMLIGSEGKLLCWRYGDKDEWRTVADLSRFGIDNVNRIALSQDERYIALVTERSPAKK